MATNNFYSNYASREKTSEGHYFQFGYHFKTGWFRLLWRMFLLILSSPFRLVWGIIKGLGKLLVWLFRPLLRVFKWFANLLGRFIDWLARKLGRYWLFFSRLMVWLSVAALLAVMIIVIIAFWHDPMMLLGLFIGMLVLIFLIALISDALPELWQLVEMVVVWLIIALLILVGVICCLIMIPFIVTAIVFLLFVAFTGVIISLVWSFLCWIIRGIRAIVNWIATYWKSIIIALLIITSVVILVLLFWLGMIPMIVAWILLAIAVAIIFVAIIAFYQISKLVGQLLIWFGNLFAGSTATARVVRPTPVKEVEKPVEQTEKQPRENRAWLYYSWVSILALIALLVMLLFLKDCSWLQPVPAPVVIEQPVEVKDTVVIDEPRRDITIDALEVRLYLDGMQEAPVRINDTVYLYGAGIKIYDMSVAEDGEAAIWSIDWLENEKNHLEGRLTRELTHEEMTGLLLVYARMGRSGFRKDLLEAVNNGGTYQDKFQFEGSSFKYNRESLQYFWVLYNVFEGELVAEEIFKLPKLSYRRLPLEAIYEDDGTPIKFTKCSDEVRAILLGQ